MTMTITEALPPGIKIEPPRPRAWLRSERLGVVIGAASVGIMLGFIATLALGRVELPHHVGSLMLNISLVLGAATLWRAHVRGSRGCATAAILYMSAVMMWPATAFIAQFSPAVFLASPLVALFGLVLFASCWRGGPLPIYAACAQAFLIGSLTAHQGFAASMGI
jgi:hypothetical protein